MKKLFTKVMRQLTRDWQGLKVQEGKGFTEGVRAAAVGEGHLKGTMVFESWEMPHLSSNNSHLRWAA